MEHWTIIADDLTGACDTGVAFAQRGWETRVAFSALEDFGGAPVRVLTTESRALAEGAAARVVERAARALGLGVSSQWYKKIDSTLRGHPGAELAAAMRASGAARALVTPAFPAQGRQVRGGQVWVHGTRLAAVELAGPGEQADLLRLFSALGSCRGVSLQELRQGEPGLVEIFQQPGVYIADAETDADLALLARAARRAGVGVWCGSAGLARALAGTFPAGHQRITLAQPGGAVLVIAGSRSPVTLGQVEMARQAGVRMVFPNIDVLRVATKVEDEADRENEDFGADGQAGSRIRASRSLALVSRLIGERLSKGEDVVVSVAETGQQPGAEAQIAAGLAALAAAAVSAARAGGLVLTGGETAAAVLKALGCTSFHLGGEVQPGVVWGHLANGPYAGLPVVTKAGGFGDANTLLLSILFLRSPSP